MNMLDSFGNCNFDIINLIILHTKYVLVFLFNAHYMYAVITLAPFMHKIRYLCFYIHMKPDEFSLLWSMFQENLVYTCMCMDASGFN